MATAAKWLVTGAGGQLGRALVEAIDARGGVPCAARHEDLDVGDADAVRRFVADRRPDVVVHAGAWTDVDGCERDPDRADRINGHGTAYVAEACASIGARLVYVSTDFVFDGSARRPYRPDDPVAPLSAYGRSKRLGEEAVLRFDDRPFWVVRTSWVFGPGGKNFPKAILARARSGEPLRVVDDQTGSPTLTLDLAQAIVEFADARPAAGVYHCSNSGQCTWHEFAVAVLRAAGFEDVEVGRMSSADLDRPAPRPTWSVLDCSTTDQVLGRPMPSYLEAVTRYLAKEDP